MTLWFSAGAQSTELHQPEFSSVFLNISPGSCLCPSCPFFFYVEVLTKFFEHPYNHFFLNSLSGRLLASISFSFFPGEFSCSFIWDLFFVFSFWLLACVCFYVLNRAATSPSLGRVALCIKCPVGPSGTVSPVT